MKTKLKRSNRDRQDKQLFAAAEETELKLLPQKMLSQFNPVSSLEALLVSDSDSIWKVEEGKQAVEGLNDIGCGAYVLALKDAVLIPGNFIGPPDDELVEQALPKWLNRRNNDSIPSHLLLTGENMVFADSFMRGRTVSAGLRFSGKGIWTGRLPILQHVVKETVVYRELVSRHFGHMLVDVPGRAWTDLYDDDQRLARLRQVAIGMNGLKAADTLEVPSYGKTLLRAFGMDPDRLEIPTRPLRFKRLLVPSRIAPYGSNSGPIFNRLAQLAGDRLIDGVDAPTGLSNRVFLSRSRLVRGISRVVGLPEERLDELFAAKGFAVVHPQELSLAQQVHTVRAATHLAGVVGSQMHLVAFSRRRDIKLLRIRPLHFGNAVDQRLLDPLNGTIVDCLVGGNADGAQSNARTPMELTERNLREIAAALDKF